MPGLESSIEKFESADKLNSLRKSHNVIALPTLASCEELPEENAQNDLSVELENLLSGKTERRYTDAERDEDM